ncbi:MAG: hypothetical protein R3Y50_03630 [Rikenellaceae bacterium]
MNIIKYILSALFALVISSYVNAQQLEEVFQKFKNAKSSSIVFSGQGERYNLITLGSKYRLESDNSDILFDGETLYSYNGNTNELVIENISSSGSLLLNPINLFSLDLSDFSYTQKKDGHYTIIPKNIENSQIESIEITLQNGEIKTLLVTTPSSYSLDLKINSIKFDENLDSENFKFNKKSYNKAEIIDFR